MKHLTDELLHANAVQTAEESRRITLKLLKFLNEIERRHLFSKFSVSSLHAYCVSQLKMDDGTAGRHVSAARLLREVPVIEAKIEQGSMTLTSVAQAGVFFRKESAYGQAFTIDEKRDLVLELENKTTRDVDRFLMSQTSVPQIHFKERALPRASNLTEVRVCLDDETMAAIERLKEVCSHALPEQTLAGVLKRALIEALEKSAPEKKIARAEQRQQASLKLKNKQVGTGEVAPAPESKVEIKRQVWLRDGGHCTFTDAESGERCQSRHFLEEDHVHPKAMGGEFSVSNIRLRCRAHNQRHAIDCYGLEKMAEHLRSIH